MCQFASFVLTKDKVFWSDKSDSHEAIIREYGLHADGTVGPNILRVEIVPPGDYEINRGADFADLSSWLYRIDQDITPEWASHSDPAAMADAESRARDAIVKRFEGGISVPGHLYLSGCTGLKALPDNLKVPGYLYLPEHLKK